MIKRSPFRYFKTSPEIIRLVVMLYVRFPLSLRNVEDLLHERGIEISHEGPTASDRRGMCSRARLPSAVALTQDTPPFRPSPRGGFYVMSEGGPYASPHPVRPFCNVRDMPEGT